MLYDKFFNKMTYLVAYPFVSKTASQRRGIKSTKLMRTS